MRIAVVQLAADVDSARNRDLIDAALADIEPGGTDLVVLPEAVMHDFGSPTHDLAAIAEPLDGPFVSGLTEQARRLDTIIVAGMFEWTDALPYNTLVVVGPDGLRSTYRKIHLYDSFGYCESDRMRAGAIEPVTIDIADLRIGLLTCYDLRFPELARALMETEPAPDVLVIPAAWVAGERKVDHWRTLLAARALENTVFVVAAGQGGERYTGHSLVADPWGSIVDEVRGTDTAVIRADLDPRIVARSREVNPSLANRRMRST